MESSGNIKDLLRSVDNLCSYQFFIPHYQRGYRWTEKQITDLLKDINNFQPQDDNKAFYCLQPLVVKSRSEHENQWDVIDGQQRLTTIYLILIFLKETNLFSIAYDKWNDSQCFLEDIANKTCDDAKKYIDYYLMHKAYKYIEEFFKEQNQEDFLKKLRENTKFIWHDVSEQISSGANISAETIFLNFNIGKIPLTDLELTKALFLRKYSDAKGDFEWKIKQQKIADEWNKIDRLFNNEDFLAFLSIDDARYKKFNKLEFLFDLKNGEPIELHGSHRIFHYFTSELNNTESVEMQWMAIKSTFVILNEWYVNPSLNKLVGYYFYLLWKDGSNLSEKIEKIKSLIDCYGKVESKDEFIKNNINGLIKNNISTLFEKIFEKDIEKNKLTYFFNLRYGDSQSNRLLKNLLVLFDILSFYNDEFYPFKKLNNVDIEHIHALGLSEDDEKSIGQGVTDEIRKAIREFVSEFHDDEIDIDEMFSKDNMSIDDFKKLSNEINDELGLNGINNLTLLPRSVNRGIKNAKFANKRKAVITLLKNNTYIHRSAQRVFMKFYSDKSDINTWNFKDRQDYLNKLKETLKDYISDFCSLDVNKEQAS